MYVGGNLSFHLSDPKTLKSIAKESKEFGILAGKLEVFRCLKSIT